MFIKICSDFDANLPEFRKIVSKMLSIPDFLMNSNKISWILTELWSEKIEWFGPSPIEPFNLALDGRPVCGGLGPHVGHVGAVVAHVAAVEPMFSLIFS